MGRRCEYHRWRLCPARLPARPNAPVAPEDAGGPLGPFLTDSSLRRGDIVVTRDGLKEFRGGDASTHAPGDFAPVEAGAGSASARGAFRSRPLPPIQQPP